MEVNNEQRLQELPPIDRFGLPTTFMSYMLLKEMFDNHNRVYTSKELSDLTCFKLSEVELICRQLKALDFLSEETSDQTRFKYNLRCENTKLQVAFERFLVEAELENLQVHLMLDYSPSYRHHERPKF